MVALHVNGRPHRVDVTPGTPLLWALRDVLGLTGTKYGCGMALCGACTVHVDGQPVRGCVTPVSAAAQKRVTTIEAIGADPLGKALQAAWLELGVPQCGYCQPGQIMSAVALLKEKPKPTDETTRSCIAPRVRASALARSPRTRPSCPCRHARRSA